MPQVTGQSITTIVTSGYTLRPYEERIRARASKFAKAWEAYHGLLPDALVQKSKQANPNVKVNVCKVIVDKGVSFLFGNEVHFNLDDDDAETSPEEEWLEKAWSYNKKTMFLDKLAITGAVCGHVFIQTIPQKPYPRLVSIDPAYVDVVTRPDDVSIVKQYIIQFDLETNNKKVSYRKTIKCLDTGDATPLAQLANYGVDDTSDETIAYVGEMVDLDMGIVLKQHWVIIEEVREEGSNEWNLVQQVPWFYSWPPVIDCQNLPMPHMYWGLSDIEEDVIHLNKAMNFVLTNTNKIIQFHAHPRPWVKGTSPDQLRSASDETLVLPSTETEIGILEMQPGGLEPSMAQYRLLKDAIHEVSRIPQVSTTRIDNMGTLSGIAMQIMYQPLIEKTRQKRTSYGYMLTELSRRMLVLGNQIPDDSDVNPIDADGSEDHDCTPIVISWPEILPKDDLELRQALSIDANLGLVSTETLSDRLGYDFETEQQRRHEEEYQMPNIINSIKPVEADANMIGDEVEPGSGPAAKNTPGSQGNGKVATPPNKGGTNMSKNDQQKRAGTRGPKQAPASRR